MLFAASLLLPVTTAQQTHVLMTIMGYELLMVGPFGILNGQFGGLATPCPLLAIHAASMRRRPMKHTTVAVTTMVVGTQGMASETPGVPLTRIRELAAIRPRPDFGRSPRY